MFHFHKINTKLKPMYIFAAAFHNFDFRYHHRITIIKTVGTQSDK